MNYNLALELKKAGFPKDFTACNGETCNMSGEPHVFGDPTLSELIEACGDGFKTLSRNIGGQKWITNAWYILGKSTPPNTNIEGSTPEEAVSRLWLELNKK